MNAFNSAASVLFDILLAPFGHRHAWFDMLLWPIAAGIVALLVYKKVSNQAGITRAKNGISVHLLEIVLFRDDLIGVLTSTAKALGQNALYVGHNILPMVVMFVPMMAILVQIVSNYALDPVPVGSVQLIEAKLEPDAGIKPTEIKLELPPGVALDAPPVRTPEGDIVWRVRAEAEGDHVLKIQAGSTTVEKGLAVGGAPRKVPVMRTKSWEGFLYPGEDGMPSDSPLYEVRTHYPDRPLPFFPDGEGGILLWFFGASLAAGFALKDKFGVTL